MGVAWAQAENALDTAVKTLFASPNVRSVGIGLHGSGYAFHVIRNTAVIMALTTGKPPPAMVQNIPVSFFDRRAEIAPHVKLPFSGPGSPGVASLVPEQQGHNPVVCGLQIENFDDDTRSGTIAGGHIMVGSIGCFVNLQTGDVGDPFPTTMSSLVRTAAFAGAIA